MTLNLLFSHVCVGYMCVVGMGRTCAHVYMGQEVDIGRLPWSLRHELSATLLLWLVSLSILVSGFHVLELPVGCHVYPLFLRVLMYWILAFTLILQALQSPTSSDTRVYILKSIVHKLVFYQYTLWLTKFCLFSDYRDFTLYF